MIFFYIRPIFQYTIKNDLIGGPFSLCPILLELLQKYFFIKWKRNKIGIVNCDQNFLKRGH